jgi:hypothetical protein
MLRRLIETPADFLEEPRTADGSGIVHVPAVVADLLEFHGDAHMNADSGAPEVLPTDRRSAGITLLLCWLLADPELISLGVPPKGLLTLLTDGAAELGSQNSAAKYRDDSERREEIVRYALARLGMRPSGETVIQAQDRLTTLSSIERNRVLAASRAAEQRAREIREALARKAAQESADKYTRE